MTKVRKVKLRPTGSLIVKRVTKRAITAPLTRENELWSEGKTWVCGVDDIGLGSLSGPVVLCAYLMCTNTKIVSGVRDSKTVSSQREKLSLVSQLTVNAGCCDSQQHMIPKENNSVNAYYSIVSISNQRIDQINILQATWEGMTQ